MRSVCRRLGSDRSSDRFVPSRHLSARWCAMAPGLLAFLARRVWQMRRCGRCRLVSASWHQRLGSAVISRSKRPSEFDSDRHRQFNGSAEERTSDPMGDGNTDERMARRLWQDRSATAADFEGGERGRRGETDSTAANDRSTIKHCIGRATTRSAATMPSRPDGRKIVVGPASTK
jgi:hypothetical protein